MTDYKTIAQTQNYIVLDRYVKDWELGPNYQSEAQLEDELIRDLRHQGYEYVVDIDSHEKMLANVRHQLQELNNVQFSDGEWKRFVLEYLDKPGETIIEKTRKVHDDYIHDFSFDDGTIKNIFLFDKKNVARNKVQVIKQFEVKGARTNRYDVTILVNGLPMVQIELKSRSVAIREAFNQIHRYKKESFNQENSLYRFIQIFVISNGTDALYFANTTSRDKDSFDFTMNWAMSNNERLRDLKDFTATFFQKNTLLNVLLNYSVFDTSNTLLIMRPYQIAATERILWKIKSAHNAKKWSTTDGGGYIWHTTGSGKTLTSFKAARLATELDFIKKVFFVVDRKDLDYQTMKEYQRFSPDSVNGSDSTAGLKKNIAKDDNKIIVTTIQKLNNLMKSEHDLAIYNEPVVFIFDECHRSQFGEAQRNLKKKFKKYYQFGFTGTPILQENTLDGQTTQGVFGNLLHSYLITDAIRDDKVLKFKVDYNDVRPKFKALETETDESKLSAAENTKALLHPERISEVTGYILKNFNRKTHRNQANARGFNALFAVSSVDAAKLYYEAFKKQQKDAKNPIKVATIFSYAANEEPPVSGEIADEGFDMSAMNSTAKEYLSSAIDDYNAHFKTNFSVDSSGFQNYYSDLAQRVKKKEVDLLIVVGMFLTGFDAPGLNTLFVDKNLRYHGLIQAYSRTNRIYDATKTFGNIVTFRDLEEATIEALKLFGGGAEDGSIAIEGSFEDYIEGFIDPLTGYRRRGFAEVVRLLEEEFPEPTKIVKEADKKAFVKLYGEYLRLEVILQNYDEFSALRSLQEAGHDDIEAIEAIKQEYNLSDETVEVLLKIKVPSDRKNQDYRSTYNDIRLWLRDQKRGEEVEDDPIDWDDVVFEVELLKSQEINFDYILELIYEKNKERMSKDELVEEVRRMIRASMDYRAKESLVVAFIETVNLDLLDDKASVIDAFFEFARIKQKQEAKELITNESLNEAAAKRYLQSALSRGYASEHGTELNDILPRMSPLNPQFLSKKGRVFELIQQFVEKFNGVGGQL
jgi:type I restriction enzyme R subunit